MKRDLKIIQIRKYLTSLPGIVYSHFRPGALPDIPRPDHARKSSRKGPASSPRVALALCGLLDSAGWASPLRLAAAGRFRGQFSRRRAAVPWTTGKPLGDAMCMAIHFKTFRSAHPQAALGSNYICFLYLFFIDCLKLISTVFENPTQYTHARCLLGPNWAKDWQSLAKNEERTKGAKTSFGHFRNVASLTVHKKSQHTCDTGSLRNRRNH